METEEQMVEAFAEKILRAGSQSFDVIRMVVKRRLNLYSHSGSELRGNFLDPLNRCFKTRHRKVREQRHQQDLVQAFLRQLAEGLRDGRVLVSHGQLNWDLDAVLELRLHVSANADHGRSSRRPDFVVSLRCFFRSSRKDGEIDKAKPP